ALAVIGEMRQHELRPGGNAPGARRFRKAIVARGRGGRCEPQSHSPDADRLFPFRSPVVVGLLVLFRANRV
ncbi:MAG TPA: hypothetical protein VKE42_02445, partial [Candidatus Cybelea sp.]|nr:hypothetical protein [Candidatus Cybelea sp.]